MKTPEMLKRIITVAAVTAGITGCRGVTNPTPFEIDGAIVDYTDHQTRQPLGTSVRVAVDNRLTGAGLELEVGIGTNPRALLIEFTESQGNSGSTLVVTDTMLAPYTNHVDWKER